jgi:energy-converting hydrogenase B subunit Q
MAERVGLVIHAESGPGILHRITGVIAHHQGDIVSVDILESRPPETRVYFEVDLPGDPQALVTAMSGLEIVHRAAIRPSMAKVYGKRIIIMGGGAQVGQVAIGAISEADRHNIRGEHISVDTIPLGCQPAACSCARAGRIVDGRGYL